MEQTNLKKREAAFLSLVEEIDLLESRQALWFKHQQAQVSKVNACYKSTILNLIQLKDSYSGDGFELAECQKKIKSILKNSKVSKKYYTEYLEEVGFAFSAYLKTGASKFAGAVTISVVDSLDNPDHFCNRIFEFLDTNEEARSKIFKMLSPERQHSIRERIVNVFFAAGNEDEERSALELLASLEGYITIAQKRTGELIPSLQLIATHLSVSQPLPKIISIMTQISDKQTYFLPSLILPQITVLLSSVSPADLQSGGILLEKLLETQKGKHVENIKKIFDEICLSLCFCFLYTFPPEINASETFKKIFKEHSKMMKLALAKDAWAKIKQVQLRVLDCGFEGEGDSERWNKCCVYLLGEMLGKFLNEESIKDAPDNEVNELLDWMFLLCSSNRECSSLLLLPIKALYSKLDIFPTKLELIPKLCSSLLTLLDSISIKNSILDMLIEIGSSNPNILTIELALASKTVPEGVRAFLEFIESRNKELTTKIMDICSTDDELRKQLSTFMIGRIEWDHQVLSPVKEDPPIEMIQPGAMTQKPAKSDVEGADEGALDMQENEPVQETQSDYHSVGLEKVVEVSIEDEQQTPQQNNIVQTQDTVLDDKVPEVEFEKIAELEEMEEIAESDEFVRLEEAELNKKHSSTLIIEAKNVGQIATEAEEFGPLATDEAEITENKTYQSDNKDTSENNINAEDGSPAEISENIEEPKQSCVTNPNNQEIAIVDSSS